MPAYNAYGTWPASGEIDLVESRGNRNMWLNGAHIGTQEAASTLHYGPYPAMNGWEKANWVSKNSAGYDTNFHRYQLEWTPGRIATKRNLKNLVIFIQQSITNLST